MKKGILFLCAGLLLFSWTASLSAQTIGSRDAQVYAVAEPILNNLFEGIKTGDYEKYLKDFNETVKGTFSQEHFLGLKQQVENQMGELKNAEYLGFLNKDDITVVLWKGFFDKRRDDILIKLVICKQGERYLVNDLWLQ